MKEDIIRQVKAAEDQAEITVQEAREKADKIVHDARHQAIENRMEILEAARTQAKHLFETGMTGFKPELEKVRQKFHDGMTEDRARAKRVFDNVVEFVEAKFKERLGSE